MIGYEFSDGGRSAAGYKGAAGDCVVRAFAILTGKPYRAVYLDMARRNKASGRRRSARNGTLSAVWQAALADYGLCKVALPAGAKPTCSEAAALFGDCIIRTARHVCAIKDGVLRDTFDGRTYAWGNEVRERKAQSVFVPVEGRSEVVRLLDRAREARREARRLARLSERAAAEAEKCEARARALAEQERMTA